MEVPIPPHCRSSSSTPPPTRHTYSPSPSHLPASPPPPPPLSAPPSLPTPGRICWQYSPKTLYNHSAAPLIRLFGTDTCHALLSNPGPTKTQLLTALCLAPADYALFERVFAEIDNVAGNKTTTSPGTTIASYMAYFGTVCQCAFLRVLSIYKCGGIRGGAGEPGGMGGHVGERDTTLIRSADLWAVTTWATTPAQLVGPPPEPPTAEDVVGAGSVVRALFYLQGEPLGQGVTAGFLYALVRCARYTWKHKVRRARGGEAPGVGTGNKSTGGCRYRGEGCRCRGGHNGEGRRGMRRLGSACREDGGGAGGC